MNTSTNKDRVATIEGELLALYENNKILWGEYCYLKMLLSKRLTDISRSSDVKVSDMHGDE